MNGVMHQRTINTSNLPEQLELCRVQYLLTQATVGEQLLLCDDVHMQMINVRVVEVDQLPEGLFPEGLCVVRMELLPETLGPWNKLRKMLWEARGPGLKMEFAPEKYLASCPEVVAGLHHGDQKEFQRRLKERGLREMGGAELMKVRPPDPMAGHARDYAGMLRAAANV